MLWEALLRVFPEGFEKPLRRIGLFPMGSQEKWAGGVEWGFHVQEQTRISAGTSMMAQHPTRLSSEVILRLLLLNLLVFPVAKLKRQEIDVKPQWETA